MPQIIKEPEPCHYCKAPAHKSNIMFVNADQSCTICDACISKLYARMANVSLLTVLDPSKMKAQ